MAKKTAKRVKHVPQRTCVGCRQILAKRALVRVVRTPEGLRVDPTGKLPGRGAYLHDTRDCWERGLKGPLAHALKVELTDQDRETLRDFMSGLPAAETAEAEIAGGRAAQDREENSTLGNAL
ncbi:MAG TPA: YlxR family protein [Anaerolineaceae bacterium]